MRAFDYEHAGSVQQAVAAVASQPEAAFLGGGTNLVDHMKLGVTSPRLLVDVNRLGLDEISERDDGGLRVGAGVRNSDLAADSRVRQRYPVLSHALLAGASGQLRNAATTAGNLLQRTRCVYFQDVGTACNKREPGSGCSALGGHAREHAILGASEHCVATHPSDMAVAMSALDAVVRVHGPDGERTIPVAQLHRLPGDEPERDTVLEHGELITAVDLPSPAPGARSTYRKVRERASYAFALVSVAAVLELRGEAIADARIVFGGLAHKPWRATLAELALQGVPLTEEAFLAAADAELAGARTLEANAYKLAMTRNVLAAVLCELTGTESER